MKIHLSLVICTLLLVFSASIPGQTPSLPEPDIDEPQTTRTTVKRLEEEIDLLRQELKKESDLRKQQTAVLESLLEKIDKLAARVSPEAATTAYVSASHRQAVAETTPTADAQPAKAQQKAVVPVEAGFGKIRFNGLVQAGLLAGDSNFNQTFRIKRVELKLSGDLMPKVRWNVMFDLAKALSLNTTTTTIDGVPVIRSAGVNQSGRIFQEAFITLSHIRRANVSIGQFKVPLSQEGLQSSTALDTIERALFLSDRGRGGGLGDSRDIGIMAFGPLSEQFDYQLGVFNGVGESQNETDQNDEKSIVGRLVFKPSLIKGLQIGGSGAYTAGQRLSTTRRDRLGAELVYDRSKLRIKSEFMIGVDGDIHRRGYYVHFGYRILPKLEVIARYDTLDPDIRRNITFLTANERDYIGGINYYIKDNNFKLQLNYVRKTYSDGLTPSRHLFMAQLQTAW